MGGLKVNPSKISCCTVSGVHYKEYATHIVLSTLQEVGIHIVVLCTPCNVLLMVSMKASLSPVFMWNQVA